VTAPVWIEERDVLAIHSRLLALHGGADGLRDVALLASSLARPRQHLAYADIIDIIGMASFYTAGIVRNHPFVDGNKRTGFVVGILFLEFIDIVSLPARKTRRRLSCRWQRGCTAKRNIALFFGQIPCAKPDKGARCASFYGSTRLSFMCDASSTIHTAFLWRPAIHLTV
jgi:death-on-curing family protein